MIVREALADLFSAVLIFTVIFYWMSLPF